MKLTCTCLCNISQMCQNLGLENLTWDSNDCILLLHKNIEADLDCDTRGTPPHPHSLLPWKVEQLVLLLIHHQAWHTCTKNRIYFIYIFLHFSLKMLTAAAHSSYFFNSKWKRKFSWKYFGCTEWKLTFQWFNLANFKSVSFKFHDPQDT